MIRIELRFIGPTQSLWAVWPWVGSGHLVHCDSFLILNFLMTIYYFIIIKNIS